MSLKFLTLDSKLYGYLLNQSLREPSVLAQLRQETAQHPMAQMQVAPEEGQFLAFLVELIHAKKVLEIGVFTGYSSLAIALALPPGGRIVACDVNEAYTAIAKKYWRLAGVADRIELRIAPAADTLAQLLDNGEADSFDFAFIDADKSSYNTYYEMGLRLVRPGGLIAIDNVLWSGKVADPECLDTRTKHLRDLNQKIHRDERVFISLLPIADGLTLARKR